MCPLGYKQFSFQFNFDNLEVKAVILEVLTVLNRVVVQVSVGYEGRTAPRPWGSVSNSYSTNVFAFCCLCKWNSFCCVVIVFQLVQHRHCNMTLKWPLEVVIKLSFHQEGKH